MAMTETSSTARKGKLSAQDRLEYRALFALAFLPCLAAASWQRLFPSGLNRAPQAGAVFAEAKSAAHAAVGYAFIA